MSVLALFSAVKSLLSPKNKGNADISSKSFSFTRWMGIFMVSCSILTSSKQFFGEPIQCKPSYFSPAMFGSYCFMSGTYTILHEDRNQSLTEGHAHTGVGAFASGRTMRHNYYQWVPFILFFQAVLYYAPYRLWKLWEGGKVGKLLFKVTSDPLTETKLEDQVEGLSKFLAANPGWFTGFARKRLICEIAILLLAVLQMYLLDLIFDGQFFGLGHEFMTVDHYWGHYRVVEEVFPLVTNCEMNFVGPAGSRITDSGMCILSINILNQKIFIISWYLQILLILFSTLSFLGEVLMLVVPGLRYMMLRSQAKTLQSHVLSRVHRYAGYSHYTLLVLLAKNMDCAQFETLLILLSDKISSGSAEQYPSSLLHMNMENSAGKKYGGGEDYPGRKQQGDSTVMIKMRPRLMSG